VSGLDRLPPDQRAVLQLILVQGRGYADLAATLRLDAAAVRERAHAGAAALADGDIDADTRGHVVDYLLGQQDEGERIVTYAALGDSPAATRWAQALRERLAPVAREELPEVPAPASVPAAVNGSGSAAAGPPPPEPTTPTAAIATLPPAPASPPAAPPREPHAPGEAGGGAAPRPSRLGGAILIAGALALAIVLAIVLIGRGGGDNGGPASTSAAQRPAARTSTATQPSSTSTTATRSQARAIGVAALRPAAGGSGLAAALIQQYRGGRRLIAVQADRMPGNSGQDFYAIWLQGSAGNRFLGFVPSQVRAGRGFLVSSDVTGVDLSGYSTVLVTNENGGQGASTPTTPGSTVLSGQLRLAG
jgi:hypothetical protein